MLRSRTSLRPLLLLLVAAACGPSKASQAVHVPGEDATIDDYEDMLAKAESALEGVGLKASAPAATKADAGGGDMAAADAAEPAAEMEEERAAPDTSGFNGDCTTLCDLASTTCELEARICVMATRHGDDARYQNACSRAGGDCELAEGVAEQSCECEY